MTAPAATLERVTWTAVCPMADLTPGRGITALVAGTAVAVFRLTGDEVAAITARDPFCGANVLGRGLVGSTGDVRYVASPMYKQRFDLATVSAWTIRRCASRCTRCGWRTGAYTSGATSTRRRWR
jgi:nitrite reductase/ring-hydroxylating ferredoxin subunit